MEMPEKEEIQNWLCHPVGQWFLSELEIRRGEVFKGLLATEAPDVYRYQGRGQELSDIERILNG